MLLAWTVSWFAGWPVMVSISGVLMALALAGAVGLVFGIYPAWLAASSDPSKRCARDVLGGLAHRR